MAVLFALWLADGAVRRAAAHTDHDHAAVPDAYANAHVPERVWTDPAMIARGKEIYATKCALCHDEKGDGKGPAAPASRPNPAISPMQRWSRRWPVTTGCGGSARAGSVEPFKSKGSAMPAWKSELPMNDRWAVIAYAHTLSGHRGPHVASEHPQLKPKPKTVTGDGTVVALRPDKQQIVVEHGEIKDFMDAMTMGYKVASASLLNMVKPGDKVRFTIDTAAKRSPRSRRWRSDARQGEP